MADLGAVIIYCYKECYNKFTDELVKETEMKEIRENFDIYLTKTKMKYLRLDTADENLKSQISKIINFLENKK